MNELTTPILGNKMSANERLACIAMLRGAIRQIARNTGDDLQTHLLTEADKLTDAELLEITRGGSQPTRGARVILCALAAGRIAQQWTAESTIKDVLRVRRWLRNRP